MSTTTLARARTVGRAGIALKTLTTAAAYLAPIHARMAAFALMASTTTAAHVRRVMVGETANCSRTFAWPATPACTMGHAKTCRQQQEGPSTVPAPTNGTEMSARLRMRATIRHCAVTVVPVEKLATQKPMLATAKRDTWGPHVQTLPTHATVIPVRIAALAWCSPTAATAVAVVVVAT